MSGHHLGDAAHRLVTNSLQVKSDRYNGHHQSHGPPPPYPPYQSNSRMVQSSSGYPPHNYNTGYGQPHVSNTHYSRSNPQTHGYYQNQHGYTPQQRQYYPHQGQGGSGYAYNGGASYHHQQQAAGWAPQGNQGGGRGQFRPQHGGSNQFSALNRDGSGRKSHQSHRR